MNYLMDLSSQRFGKLTVIKQAETPVGKSKYRKYWHCRCDCGAEEIVERARLPYTGNKARIGSQVYACCACRLARQCAICKRIFIRSTSQQKVCSPACKKKLLKNNAARNESRWKKAWRKNNPEQAREMDARKREKIKANPQRRENQKRYLKLWREKNPEYVEKEREYRRNMSPEKLKKRQEYEKIYQQNRKKEERIMSLISLAKKMEDKL